MKLNDVLSLGERAGEKEIKEALEVKKVDGKYICPKCKGMRKDPFSLDGKKVFSPKWKTVVKGMSWQCKNCGYIKNEKEL